MSDANGAAGLDELRQLFQTELRAVSFPGIDAEVLEGAASRVHDAQSEVERCEAALAAARQLLVEAEEDELGRAQRALAYARVYAEDQPALHQRLAAIVLPSATRDPLRADDTATAAPRRRGRPPKQRPGGAPSLFAPEAPIAAPTVAPTATPTAASATPPPPTARRHRASRHAVSGSGSNVKIARACCNGRANSDSCSDGANTAAKSSGESARSKRVANVVSSCRT